MTKFNLKLKYLYIIPIIVLVLGFCIFPLGLFKTEKQSVAKEKGMAVSGPITETVPIAGVFLPDSDGIVSLGFRFYVPGSSKSSGYLQLLLKDQQDKVIYESTVFIRDLENNQYHDFPIPLPLEAAQPYVYQLTAYDYDATPPCIYLGSPDTAAIEHQSLYYNSQKLPGNAPIMRFTYQNRTSFSDALPYYIILISLLLLTIPLWGYPFRKFWTVACVLAITVLLVLASDESRRSLILTGDNLRREAGYVDGHTLMISPDSGYSGRLAYTWNYMLEKGNYLLGLEYRTDTADNILSVTANGKTILEHKVNPDYTYQEVSLPLESDAQEVQIELLYGGTAALTLNSIELIPESRFYNDAPFTAILLLVSGGLFLLITTSRHYKQLPVTAKMTAFGLLAITAAASLPLMNSYLNWADDLCYHLIRIEGIKDGLLDGQFPVIIYPEGLYGNGYLNCMYPNLFLYIPAILRILGVSMANSYKSLMVLFHLATAYITYYSVKSMMQTESSIPPRVCTEGSTTLGSAVRFSAADKAALLASLLYTLSPYRFTNAYARGALGEFLAMTFMPLLLAGLYHVLLGRRKKWWMLVLGLSGLIQTHVLSAVIGLILCIVCGILCLRTVIREKRFPAILCAALLTLLLNLWFAVPFVYFYTKGGLWPSALDWCNFSEYSLNLSGLAGTINTQDYRTLTLGLPIVCCAAIALFALSFIKKKDRLCKFTTCLFLLGCVSTFMVINQFPGWQLMHIGILEFLFKNIQFAWRMLAPASILFTMAGCILLFRFGPVKPYRKGIFLALATVALLSSVHYQSEDFAYKNYYDTFTRGHESKLRGIPKGDNTIVYPYEWRPYGTMESDLFTDPIFSDQTAVNVQEFTKDGTTGILTYICSSPDVTVSFPLVHYAGYQACDENGKRIELFTNVDNNTIQVDLIGDSQTHKIIVEYKGLACFTIAFWVSVLTLAVWLWLLLKHSPKGYINQVSKGNVISRTFLTK